MRLKRLAPVAAIAVALTLAGCSTSAGKPVMPGTSSVPPAPAPASAPRSPTASADSTERSVVGTLVRFAAGSDSVNVRIGVDSPATRDFLSMLPLTLTLEEFNGREKIADLPRELDHTGSPGSDPEDGDLIYFVPWGNIGFYYNTDGIGYSDQTLHLGTYDATEEELTHFEGRETTVEIVD